MVIQISDIILVDFKFMVNADTIWSDNLKKIESIFSTCVIELSE